MNGLDTSRPLLRERVPWQVVRDGDESRWTVSIHVPLVNARCEAVISVVLPATQLPSEAAR